MDIEALFDIAPMRFHQFISSVIFPLIISGRLVLGEISSHRKACVWKQKRVFVIHFVILKDVVITCDFTQNLLKIKD